MESALWNLEDKWKLSTQESIAFFICICSLVIGICIVTVFIRRRVDTRRKGLVGQDPCSSTNNDIEWSEPKLLSRTLRWSGPTKWDEKRSRSHRKRVSPLLVAAGQLEGESNRWHSHNSDSPVWQRPILMGEKCELPRFSGLILYDERGRPVHQNERLDKKVEDGVVKERTPKESNLAYRTEDLEERVNYSSD